MKWNVDKPTAILVLSAAFISPIANIFWNRMLESAKSR